MTKIRLVFALMSAAPIAACGGDEQSAAIVGTWGLDRGDGCLLATRFGADGEWRQGLACALETGQVGVERHEGSYTAAGGALEIDITHSTCADSPRSSVSRYEVRGDQLVIEDGSTRLLFERVESDGEGSGVFRNGCWEGDMLVYSDLRALE